MDLNPQKCNRWVNDRLATLEPPSSWMPDAGRALARLREFERAGRARRLRWIWASSVTGVAAAICVAVLFSPQACATPRTCAQSMWNVMRPKPAVTPAAIPEPVPEPAVMPIANFKEFGPAMAAVTVEVYSDFECPACAQLHRDVIPLLMAQYVKTGKIRLVFRDFPLQQHPYARVAARLANAAGPLGYYEAAANRIFATQSAWNTNGAVEAQLASALPPAIMKKVHDAVATDKHLDDSVEADLAAGRKDLLNQTPSLVIVNRGKRQLVPGVPPFELLKRYLDGLLTR